MSKLFLTELSLNSTTKRLNYRLEFHTKFLFFRFELNRKSIENYRDS